MQSETATNASAPPYRLPVNPRRHKVAPEQRKRVVTACNACNVRRIRCSGDTPCQRCRKAKRECEYPPESGKNSLKSEIDRLRKRCAALEKGLNVAAPKGAADILSQLDCGESAVQSTRTMRSVSSESGGAEVTKGCLLRDPDNTQRYLGETSGATFLDSLKEFMATLVVPLTIDPDTEDGSSFLKSIGRYQTFDSRPLPNPDVDPLWLPSSTEMRSMLAELRYYLQDGSNGKFPSGGIYWWGDLSNLPPPVDSSATLVAMTTGDRFRFLAFYHICFALATSIGHASFRHSEQHTGEAYFKRARLLIGNPLDTVRFTSSDVPVLILMAFYLIEVNRRDAAYMYCSLAVHIAIIHGSFRTVIDEPSTRTFWTLYVLDRWLAVLMGRPPTIPNEAIRLPLPCDVPLMPSAAGLRAHVELSRISCHIVCETFKIAPRNNDPVHPTNNIEKALNMLQQWLSGLPETLLMREGLNNSDPSCYILHMAHNQLIVLTTRPVVFATIKRAIAQQFFGRCSPGEPSTHAEHIEACIQAAHRNILLAQQIIASERKLLQAGIHFVFNAAVILLLKRMLDCAKDNDLSNANNCSRPKMCQQDLHAPGIHTAMRIFEEESRTGTNYPRDCYRVLQDLQTLTDRYRTLNCGERQLLVTFTDVSPESLSACDGIIHATSHGSDAAPSDSDVVYQGMIAWVQPDGLRLYDNFYM